MPRCSMELVNSRPIGEGWPCGERLSDSIVLLGLAMLEAGLDFAADHFYSSAGPSRVR